MTSVGLLLTLAGLLPARAEPVAPAPSPLATEPSPQPSQTPSPAGIAFDQIDRTIPGAGTPPPVNNFVADLAAVKAYQSASLFPSQQEIDQEMALAAAEQALSLLNYLNPFAAAAASAAEEAENTALRKKAEERMNMALGPDPGRATRYFFYNGWIRIEVPNLVVIDKPEQHLRIFLNPNKKTYRTEDTSAAPSPQPDTGETPPPGPIADVTVTTSLGEAATIVEQATISYRSDATATLSGGVDPCVDGTYRATLVEYFTQAPEPLTGEVSDARGFYALALPQDCWVNYTPVFSGPSPPYGQMYVYRLVTVVRNAALAAQTTTPEQRKEANMVRSIFGGAAGPGANYMQLSERGNIRELGPEDAALFEIPLDYTMAQ